MSTAMQRWFSLDALGALVLALAWISPLVYAVWAAFHDVHAAIGLDLSAPWTLANFRAVWQQTPWLAYIANTIKLVTTVLIGQLVLCTLAGFAFARFEFPGRGVVFILVLILFRTGSKMLIGANSGGMHGTALIVTDALIAMALGFIVAQRVEMYLRARRLLASPVARPSSGGAGSSPLAAAP